MATPTITDEFDFYPAIGCPNCDRAVKLTPRTFIDHYKGRSLKCTRKTCAAPMDLQQLILADIKKKSPEFALGAAGATSTQFKVQVVPNEVNTITRDQLGIPKDATLLTAYLSTLESGGHGYLPALLGERHPTFRIEEPIAFFPVEIPPAPHRANSVALSFGSVTWTDSTIPDNPWLSLLDAFTAHARSDFNHVMLPAQTAIENTIGRFLSHYLVTSEGLVAEEELERIPYSTRLRVLLPLCAKAKGLNGLDRQSLTWVRALAVERNSMAHTGLPKNKVSLSRSAQFLCGSLFTMEYVRYLG